MKYFAEDSSHILIFLVKIHTLLSFGQKLSVESAGLTFLTGKTNIDSDCLEKSANKAIDSAEFIVIYFL